MIPFLPLPLRFSALTLVASLCLWTGFFSDAWADETSGTIPTKEELYQHGLEAVQSGDYQKALAIASVLQKAYPQEEASYRIMVVVLTERKDFPTVVALVRMADRMGIKSLFLYTHMTRALYHLGGFSASLHGFKKIEELLAAEQAQ